MAQNLSSLAQNITDSASSLGDTVFQRNPPPDKGRFPGTPPTGGQGGPASGAISKVLNELDQSNWTKSLPYSFAVVPEGNLSGNFQGFTEFPLNINPSELNQDETFAISIKPTQGGTIVNNGGVKYGDLVISGTTGVHPNKGAGGASKRTGEANFAPNSLANRSGYEVFIRLRNWLKAYYQAKKLRNETDGPKGQLIFKNFKDGEFLKIEVTRFTLRRSATRKTLYDYNITCRILGRENFTKPEGPGGIFGALNEFDQIISEGLSAIDEARGIFLRGQDILRQIESTYEQTVIEPLRKATLAAKAFTGIGTVAADVSSQAISNTVSAAGALGLALGIKDQQEEAKTSGGIDPRIVDAELPRNVDQAAQVQGSGLILELSEESDVLMAIDSAQLPARTQEALAQEQSDALDQPRSFYESAIEEIKRVRDNAADSFNLGDPTFNAQFDRISTASVDPNKIVNDQEFEILDAFEKALDGLRLLVSTNAFFTSSYEERIENAQSRFPDGLPDLVSRDAVEEIVMPANSDLERVALTQLGNADRWVEIAELNNLKPPYVVQDLSDTTPNVVNPGDKLLIPRPVIEGFGNTPTVKERFINETLNAVERNLGIDFQINKNFDFVLTNKGDLGVVSGADNAAQAVILKMSYEKEELLEHPNIGIGVQVGNTGVPLNELRTNLIQTLTADPRFESVEGLLIKRVDNFMNIKFTLRVKNVDTPVPIELNI